VCDVSKYHFTASKCGFDMNGFFDRYEKSEQEKWKEHMALVQGSDGLRGSRASSSFMKKARIEGEAKVTLKDLLDAGILNAGEEFTFKGQVP
jgi:hypothetical protein